jgi:hypothetical protein
MLALAASFERFVARNGPTFMTSHQLDWEAGGRRASRLNRSADVLCFGDSMLKFGLAPRVVGEALGCSFDNLALLDGKPAASYFLFRRAIEAGARPGLVLVDFQPECLYQSPESLLTNPQWKALVSFRECLELAWTFRDAGFLARTFVARWLPSYRCREKVNESVRLALAGKPNPNPGENAKIRRNRAMNRGGLLLAKQPGFRGDVPQGFAKTMFTRPWFSRPEHTEYVRKFLRLAERHRIAIVWVLPPNTPEAERTRERIGLAAGYDRFLEGIQRRFANVSVLDGRRSGFDHTVFVDPVHLDREGAAAFSLSVAEALRPILSGRGLAARWTMVPRPGSSSPAIALEDIEQSAASLRR